VAELGQSGAQHLYFDRRLGQIPPWRQCCLRVTEVARVALLGNHVVIPSRQRRGDADIARIGAQLVTQLEHFPRNRIIGAQRQAFQHLLVRLRYIRCRLGYKAGRRQQQDGSGMQE
jgi:hypothetical protein